MSEHAKSQEMVKRGRLAADEYGRPLLRGYFHLGASVAAAGGCILIVLLANSAKAYVGGAVFAVSLLALYTTSGLYHSIRWGPPVKDILKRLDHAMIFVLIAGTYTPFCLFAGSPAWGVSLLAVVWSIAGVGVGLKIAWPNAPRWLSVALYLGSGWIALVAATKLTDWYAIGPLAVVALGGVLYSAGGIIYGLRRPNPFPRVFGYHEVFHVLVIAGSALHFSVVAVYLMPS
jgi:hemolysin III